MEGLGFGVQGLGFRVWGLGFRVEGLVLDFWVQDLRFRVWGLEFRVCQHDRVFPLFFLITLKPRVIQKSMKQLEAMRCQPTGGARIGQAGKGRGGEREGGREGGREIEREIERERGFRVHQKENDACQHDRVFFLFFVIANNAPRP